MGSSVPDRRHALDDTDGFADRQTCGLPLIRRFLIRTLYIPPAFSPTFSEKVIHNADGLGSPNILASSNKTCCPNNADRSPLGFSWRHQQTQQRCNNINQSNQRSSNENESSIQI